MDLLTLHQYGTQQITDAFNKTSDFNIRVSFAESKSHNVTLLRSLIQGGIYSSVDTINVMGDVFETSVSGVVGSVFFKVVVDDSAVEVAHD